MNAINATRPGNHFIEMAARLWMKCNIVNSSNRCSTDAPRQTRPETRALERTPGSFPSILKANATPSRQPCKKPALSAVSTQGGFVSHTLAPGLYKG